MLTFLIIRHDHGEMFIRHSYTNSNCVSMHFPYTYHQSLKTLVEVYSLLTLFTGFIERFFYLITLTISLGLKHNFIHLYDLVYWVPNFRLFIKPPSIVASQKCELGYKLFYHAVFLYLRLKFLRNIHWKFIFSVKLQDALLKTEPSCRYLLKVFVLMYSDNFTDIWIH